MKTTITFIAVLLLFNIGFYLTGCNKDDSNDIIVTDPVNLKPDSPGSPVPADSAQNTALNATLSWSCSDPENDSLTYDIFFGTTNPPSLQVENTTETVYQPDDLQAGTEYFWKIRAHDNHQNTSQGPLWTFTTITAVNRPPSAPSNPIPSNHAVQVELDVELTWESVDPDGDPLTYYVYLGENNIPDFRQRSDGENSYRPVGLTYSHTYYWQIVVQDDHGHELQGPLWVFSTISTDNQPPETPKDPNPTNNAMNVATDAYISWGCSDADNDPLRYDVYLGLESDPPLVTNGISQQFYNQGGFQSDTRYFWKIIARDDHAHVVAGPVWTFSTEGMENRPPDSPFDPGPMVGDTVNINTDLSWSCSDPDDDPLRYDVYFGVDPLPPLIRLSNEDDFFALEPLEYNTLYNWKIVARDDRNHETEGPIWSFRTMRERENRPPVLPFDPFPANESSIAARRPGFTWECSDPDDDTLRYDFYLGTNIEPNILAWDLLQRTFIPNNLENHSRYYWKVVAKDNNDHFTEGPVWTFGVSWVNEPPTVPYSPYPQDGGTEITLETNLYWWCTDPDGDDLLFDLYFGTTQAPLLIASGLQGQSGRSTYIDLYDLEPRTYYFWQVKVRDGNDHELEGPVWRFETGE